MTSPEDVARARRIIDIQERYADKMRRLDIEYRREMLFAAGEPQPGLWNSERWSVERIMSESVGLELL